jgi:hypothetical protein
MHDATVVLVPELLEEADQLLAGDAATRALARGSTRRMRRLHTRLGATPAGSHRGRSR